VNWLWAAIVVVAILVALDKALVPGAAMLGVGVLAQFIPAREATGVTLAMCILGDWMTIWAYRHDVDWRTLGRLLPNVAGGVVLGAGFLFIADDGTTRRVIGAIILVFVSWNVIAMLRRRGGSGAGTEVPTAQMTRGARWKRSLYGGLAGFTTMVANAGGPATSMYFMSEGFPVRLFLGTGAWFYLVINLVKLPFAIGLGMLSTRFLVPLIIAVPFMIATVAVGRWVSGRIDKSVFNVLVVVLTLVTGVTLLV
jgi:uncharacterized membrane protein YfcA